MIGFLILFLFLFLFFYDPFTIQNKILQMIEFWIFIVLHDLFAKSNRNKWKRWK